MSYFPKVETERCEAPAGFAPWRPMSDAEFEATEAAYDAQFSDDQRGSMRRYFEHIEDEPATTKRKAARSAGSDDR